MTDVSSLQPVMLSGLSWPSAQANLKKVDCALRRPHWCSPVVVLIDGKLMLDDDGDLAPLRTTGEERCARDWQMLPRVDDDGKPIAPAYR